MVLTQHGSGGGSDVWGMVISWRVCEALVLPHPSHPPTPCFLKVCPQSWIQHLGEIEEGREKYSRDSLSILRISLGVGAPDGGDGNAAPGAQESPVVSSPGLYFHEKSPR